MSPRWIGTMALVYLAAAACARATPLDIPSGDPLVRGPVETIDHGAAASGLLVRGGPGSREPCGIAARADGRTRYLERSDAGTLQQIEVAALSVGDTVEVFVEGPVAESCPVQGYASTIVRVWRGGP